jgi:hypothetical protein
MGKKKRCTSIYGPCSLPVSQVPGVEVLPSGGDKGDAMRRSDARASSWSGFSTPSSWSSPAFDVGATSFSVIWEALLLGNGIA